MSTEAFHIFQLPNGIRVIHLPVNGADVAHAGLIINAGSRDEAKDEQGLAHFIEHALFKGTKKRKAYHILSGLDAVGGELNAYTTKENTTIYASFQSSYFEKAIELISDITFNATFPAKELEKEKEVIIDEIYSYKDNPSEQIYDDFEEQIFNGHAIGRNILGTTDSVRKLRQKHLLDFRKRNFTTENMVLSIVGNISSKKVSRVLDKYMSHSRTSLVNKGRKAFKNYKPTHRSAPLNGHQEHCIIGNVAYSADDSKRGAMILLDNIIGGPALNSLLNLEIREKYGFTYNIDSSYTPYSDTGIFAIYYGTDKRHSNRTRDLIMRILKRLRDKKMGPRQLSQAHKQLIGQMALSRESRVNLMLALGKSLLQYDRVDSLTETYAKIEAITAENLLEVANEVLREDTLSSLVYPAK